VHIAKRSIQDLQKYRRENIHILNEREERERVLIPICGVARDNENCSRLSLKSQTGIPYQPDPLYHSTIKYNNFLHNYF
jgi:hypothetical protein